MRKLLNTLHVTTQGAYLHRDGETVAVKVNDEFKMQIPVHTLEGLVCRGRISCSPPLLELCCERGIGISYTTEHGRFLARVTGPTSGDVLLRRQQYRMADAPDATLRIVRSIVAAKIANSRVVLLRAARETSDAERQQLLRAAGARMAALSVAVLNAVSTDEARGQEGAAGQLYFASFDDMIVGDRDAFQFRGRSRRPPLDRVNALLSFVYALLRHNVESALESVGLDPAVGFLHSAGRGDRASHWT